MGTGTDVDIENAMITLVKGNIYGIVKVRGLSNTVVINIKAEPIFRTRLQYKWSIHCRWCVDPFFGTRLLYLSIGSAFRLRNIRF